MFESHFCRKYLIFQQVEDPKSLGDMKDYANEMLSFYCPASITVLVKEKCHISCLNLPPASPLQLSSIWKKIVSLFSISNSCFFLLLFSHKHHEIIIWKEGNRERLIKKLVFQFEAFTGNQKLLELCFQKFVIWTKSLDKETGCN